MGIFEVEYSFKDQYFNTLRNNVFVIAKNIVEAANKTKEARKDYHKTLNLDIDSKRMVEVPSPITIESIIYIGELLKEFE